MKLPYISAAQKRKFDYIPTHFALCTSVGNQIADVGINVDLIFDNCDK